MMKYVLALVVMLHFCYSFTVNRDLNKEIIHGLNELRNLTLHKEANITSPETMRTPAFLARKASSCVHVFVKELKHLLNNVSVHEDKKGIIEGLKDNLDQMDLTPSTTIPKGGQECPMKTGNLNPFHPYAILFKQLNRSKKR